MNALLTKRWLGRPPLHRRAHTPPRATAAAAAAAPAAPGESAADARARARVAAQVLSHIRQLSRAKGTSEAAAAPIHGSSCVRVLPSPPAPRAWRELAAEVARAPEDLQTARARLADPNRRVVLPEEGEGGCYLARRPWVHALRDRELAKWLRALFAAACDPRGWRAAGLLDDGVGPFPPRLSRFDLWHAHAFIAAAAPAPVKASGGGGGDGDGSDEAAEAAAATRAPGHHHRHQQLGLGLLFHAREYPARCDGDGGGGPFPYHLGNCQAGSDLEVTPRCMDTRNLLFFEDTLAVLDVGPSSPLHASLLHPGTAPLRTVYEEDFGRPLVDVLCLPPPQSASVSSSGTGDVISTSTSIEWAAPARDGEAWFHFCRPPEARDIFVSY